MATNYKALALMLPAAKVIVTSGVDLPERMVLTVVLVLITSIPAWLPVILEVVLPGSMDRIIGAIKHFLDRFGHRSLPDGSGRHSRGWPLRITRGPRSAWTVSGSSWQMTESGVGRPGD
jgi:hypothetical protein